MASRNRIAGFTLIEMIVGMAVATIVLALAWQFFSPMMRGSKEKTTESFLRMDGVMGIEKLNRRLQEAIQVVDPKPGQTSSSLVFRDILNEQITLSVKDHVLVSIGKNGDEKEPEEMITPSGSKFTPTHPIRIPGCAAAQFTTVSPTCVVLTLTIEGEGQSTTLVNTVELHNANLAR